MDKELLNTIAEQESDYMTKASDWIVKKVGKKLKNLGAEQALIDRWLRDPDTYYTPAMLELGSRLMSKENK